MMQAEKPELFRLIRSTIDTFATDWRKNPTRWLQEIDVQCELTFRLKQTIHNYISQHIIARHSHYSNKYAFSRITCEPYVSLGGGTSYAHPDIVIWGDSVEDGLELNSGQWPILWACEIKYKSSVPDSTDLDRLKQMLSDKTLYCGCWLKLLINTSTIKPDHYQSQDERLWIIEVSANVK